MSDEPEVSDEIDLTLGPAIRRIRKAQGRQQEALAYDAGITVATLGRIERSTSSPNWATIRRIVTALGITVVELASAIEHGEG